MHKPRLADLADSRNGISRLPRSLRTFSGCTHTSCSPPVGAIGRASMRETRDALPGLGSSSTCIDSRCLLAWATMR